MLSLPSRTKMYLCMNPVDMRKSFDGLFGIVKQEFQQDPLNGHLFLFVNKRRDRMKAIFWDDDGFVIWYKRLEVGTWQLREEHRKAIDELRLFRRWVYGSRRERHVADAKQQHLFDMGALFAELEPSAEHSSADSEVSAGAEDAARAAAAQEKAARRRKKRADRKL